MVYNSVMELKEIIKAVRWRTVVITALLGALAGLGYYATPKQYNAQGSFLVLKETQTSEDGSFSYEGYYSQQVAISMANTLSALIESPDVGAQVLSKIGKGVTEKNLRQYKSNVRVAKRGPQLVTLIAKGKTPQEALTLWTSVADSVEPLLSSTSVTVQRAGETPIAVAPYNNPLLFVVVGIVTGALGTLVVNLAQIYFKD
jgi:capsular polysaccharide biosynthesis protein